MHPFHSVPCSTITSFSLAPCPVTNDVTVTESNHLFLYWSSSPFISLQYLMFLLLYHWSSDTMTQNFLGPSHCPKPDLYSQPIRDSILHPLISFLHTCTKQHFCNHTASVQLQDLGSVFALVIRFNIENASALKVLLFWRFYPVSYWHVHLPHHLSSNSHSFWIPPIQSVIPVLPTQWLLNSSSPFFSIPMASFNINKTKSVLIVLPTFCLSPVLPTSNTDANLVLIHSLIYFLDFIFL